MLYQSTRSVHSARVSAAEAIRNGLAPDGGLYMPESVPALTKEEIGALIALPYPERAAFILGKYLTDYTAEELLEDCRAAYTQARFPGGSAPVVSVEPGMFALELWHGPTCAFKDMALQIMPRLLSRALRKTKETRTALILVATSGDTGKAALEGYRDVDQVKIQVFYPENGVSAVQKRQMQTQEGGNVSVCAIRGNFDDAQTGVKKIFASPEMAKKLNEKGYLLSSANSINWGRLAPQIAYYVSAYCDLVQNGSIRNGDEVDFCVPTGNFGNIFAGYLARKMGLPIRRLVCASNRNNILTDFLTTGRYDRNRPFYTTMSPSMDILISSNLERLLYLIAGPEKTAGWMKKLSENGCYTVDQATLDEICSVFSGYCADEAGTAFAIRRLFTERRYLSDTHTAVAFSSAEKYLRESAGIVPLVVVSTASPFKFAADVYRALTDKCAENDVAALDALAAHTGRPIPAPLAAVLQKDVRFCGSILPGEMPDEVLRFAAE